MTSPCLFKDESPYKIPLALGLLFSLVFTLFLLPGFVVVAFVGFVFGLIVFLAGFGFGVVVVDLGLAFCFVALASATACSTIALATLFSDTSLFLLESSIFSGTFSLIILLSFIPARAEFFFLFEVFLKI